MTLGLWKSLISPVTNLVAGWSKRKDVKLQGKLVIDQAKVDLKVAKIKAKITETLAEKTRDYDYDMQVLKNRNNTSADEVIIFLWFTIFVCHFIPYTQPYMAKGWLAMGYTQVPKWFEFGMVLILVSTLGGMRLFRMMFGQLADKFKKKADSRKDVEPMRGT